jgi:hypothetical protein
MATSSSNAEENIMRSSLKNLWLSLALCAVLIPFRAALCEETAGQRVFVCGHSFHVYIAKPLEELAKAAGIANHVNLGVQFLGGSSVTQHWDLPDEKNKCKQALATGNVDVLTLSPNWVIPDPAMDRFVDLALKNNPKTKVVVQMSWPAFDSASLTGVFLKNEERDSRPVSDVEKAMESFKPRFEKQINDINARLGRQVVFVAPVAKALLALRQKVEKGEVPGITKQSELFNDPLGHGKEPVQRLAEYCNFATIYQKCPCGFKTFEKPGNENWNKLNQLLQQLAWDAVCDYPLSGVKKETTDK